VIQSERAKRVELKLNILLFNNTKTKYFVYCFLTFCWVFLQMYKSCRKIKTVIEFEYWFLSEKDKNLMRKSGAWILPTYQILYEKTLKIFKFLNFEYVVSFLDPKLLNKSAARFIPRWNCWTKLSFPHSESELVYP
jgi:hypothetical protein